MKEKRYVPKLRCHRPSGRAFVELNGRRHYLGKFGDEGTKQAYERTIAEWEANGRQNKVDPFDISVMEMIAKYWVFVQGYFLKDGKPTNEQRTIRCALRPLRELYGETPALKFGPMALKVVRDHMISQNWARNHINKQISRIKRVFKWAASEELLPADVYHRLQTIEGLKRGRSEARETKPVLPVPEFDIEAVKAQVSRQVRALIDLQLLTAARAGELITLRPMDFDRADLVWLATPETHKTEHMGRERTIYIGPKAQAIVKEFLLRPADTFLFSPREAEDERSPFKTDERVGERYSVDSYRRAIARACKRANVPKFAPHRLRHTAATQIRRHYGVEGAQLLLGHARADVTQLYAERDETRAIAIAQEIG